MGMLRERVVVQADGYITCVARCPPHRNRQVRGEPQRCILLVIRPRCLPRLSELPAMHLSRRISCFRVLRLLACVLPLGACALYGRSAAPDVLMASGASLAIPVRGVLPEQLKNSYDDARSGGRAHHAIDIMAPRNTPVQAVADGRVLKLRTGGMGGITIYQIDRDGRTLYYYAHLRRYAHGMKEGREVRRGDVIGYVGDTGNAGRGNYHLHLSVGVLRDPHRWWESDNINPYPLLAGDAARHDERSARGGS